ncbi:conserved hypothetical protein [Deferribacter desulfuricans SSM1]|uniref:ADP-ribosylglycohydrolase n=1 Tax=Deferribacter desulfuricans (strain DSM 14783 / JCM 11476 / NBRC 101012 / SSM1) TaxID=639282 RepID=D3PA83_DEFDS|nr:ADP-ribosylglycohydrolase family protein [Deferribacter desulfuricans]BAI81623.1 conserved hypothetical protein [Deferribacter desulfuricans SSM1]
MSDFKEHCDKVSDCMQKTETQSVFNELEKTKKDKIAGMIAGNIIGDMLGITQEGCFPTIKPYPPIKLEGEYQKNIIGGGHLNLNAGDWSDDTSMLIALATSLDEKRVVDENSERKHYLKWFYNGEYSSTNTAIGIGKTTYKALKTGKPQKDRLSNGNGALMRSSIITAYYLDKTDKELIEDSAKSASVTHGHPIALFTNSIYNLLLKYLILNYPLEEALEKVKNTFYDIIEDINPIFEEPDIYTTTPYCVTTLQTAIWLNMESKNFEEAVLKAINIGGDTDTIGAVTGAIAGAIYGFESIPKRFKKYLFKPPLTKYTSIMKFFIV